MKPTDDPESDDPELIAYLDGELGADASRTVESKIGVDPAMRVKVDEYKKTYDLLDYLPKPEPSPSFTTRTLTRLHPVTSSSTMVPSVPSLGRKRWPEWLLWASALVAVGAAGYFGHSLARSYWNPVPEAEKFDQADLPLIHDLPYLLGVDDFDFLKLLRQADIFDEGTGSSAIPATNEPRETVSLVAQQKLIEQFQNYAPARRLQLRNLYRELNELPVPERASYRRMLETYAAWLDRLPDSSRKEILAAPNGGERLDAVLRVRERLWRESLPPSQQKALKSVASVVESTQLLNEWRRREQSFRSEWELTRQQWQPNKLGEHKAWPFYDSALTKSLDEFIRKSFGVDLTQPALDRKADVAAPCRLTREELTELRYRHEAALKEGYWYSYGACLLQLAELHPMLPEPAKGKPITTMDQPPLTPQKVRSLLPKDGTPLLSRLKGLGRWPDFALEIQRLDANSREKLPPLGPCKPGEFSDELEQFLKGDLLPKLSKPERDKFDSLQGKWPEYPKMMIELAKAKNLSVPGAMLPGEPKLWNENFRIGKK